MIHLFDLCEAGAISLVASDTVVLENSRNPYQQRRASVASILEQAEKIVVVDSAIRDRAKMLETRGFKAFDALHVACAEAGDVQCFCTCDDRLMNKLRRRSDVAVRVVTRLELRTEVSK